MRLLAPLCLAASLAGCVVQPDDFAEGSVDGYALTSPTAVCRVESGGTALYSNDIYVVISDTPNLCQAASAEVVPGMHLYFENGAFTYEREVESSTDWIEERHGPRKDAEAVFVDPIGRRWMGRGGTITIADYDEDGGDCLGQYDVEFDGNQWMRGAFHARYCPGMRTAADGCGCAASGGAPAALAAVLGLLGLRRRRR